MSAKLNPLANPKGQKKLCEICQKPAHIQCTRCRVTFYCNTEHQQADWVSIHEKVCQLLILIRKPAPFHAVQADRDKQRNEIRRRQEELIEISQAAARRRLSEGSHQEALPAAQFSLRCAMDVYGSSAIRLVPSYLLMAEASMGLGKLVQAKEYLSLAEWTVVQTPNCSNNTLHQLHRNMGRLYAATGDLEEALWHLAEDVFYATEGFGLDSVVTCQGYFLMANVFLRQNKADIANSIYSEVARKWHIHLTRLLVQKHTQEHVQAEQLLDEGQRAEAEQTLRTLLEAQEQSSKPQLEQSAILAHCLAMLWYLSDCSEKALEFGRKAMELSQQVSELNLSDPIKALLERAEESLMVVKTN
ncbi:zinc finger MYND domain-containing protein 12 [Chanos chanos]|uniref:Zinc finger MYND domain-containing protein 12 n=1 Tax=Chanos chanos TaxID=29144 RepID=A0A6J2W9P5_CHACN|nr:zinc finger MYND domain-containing protein 12 [Chanos chanos]